MSRPSDKLPAFQFYPGDWRRDPGVQALDHAAKGVWIDLLCMMHDSPERGRLVFPTGAAMPDAAIARNLGMPEADWKQIRSTLISYGVASEDEKGVLFNRRMVREEALRQKKIEAGRKGGERSGEVRGRGRDRKQNNEQPESRREAERKREGGSSSSSSSSHLSTDANASGAAAPQTFPHSHNEEPSPGRLMALVRDGDPETETLGLYGHSRKPPHSRTEGQDFDTITTLIGKGVKPSQIEAWIIGAAMMREAGLLTEWCKPGESMSLGAMYLNKDGIRPFALTAEAYYHQQLERGAAKDTRGMARLKVEVG